MEEYEALRQEYLVLRERISDARWTHGILSPQVNALTAERDTLLLRIQPLARQLNVKNWPPSPWDKPRR